MRLRSAVLCALLAACGSPNGRPAPARSTRQPETEPASAVREPAPTHPRITLGRARVFLEREGAPPVVVEVDVAATDALRRRGLMYRRTMGPDEGMLFVFDEPDVQTFWMRNTYLRLDMIFIGDDRRVVGLVENAPPLTDEDRAIEVESRYVLEVHGGFARRHGISAGTNVRFEGLRED